MLANCLHDLAAIGPGGLATVALALFLAGLAGGFTHCAGMCAPFVLAQAGANVNRSAAGGSLQRLSGAALVPYHLGRVLGYGALGAVAGATAGLVTQITGLRFVLAALLLSAAILMCVQAASRLPVGWRPRLAHLGSAFPAMPVPGEFLLRRVGPLLAAPSGWNGVGLGVLLSALPCGLLYAALAGAAATGSALAGAIAMAAFTAGTVPALIGVGLLGRLFLRSRGDTVRLAGAVLFLLNGAVLAAMAYRMVA